MSDIAGRYRTHADAFERKVAAVRPDQWSNQSPCEDWDARDVVRHVVGMHAAMLGPIDRSLSPAPSVDDDPLAAFTSARADVAAVLADPGLAGIMCDTPAGAVRAEQHIDEVVSDDMVIHGWDLARATGQDETIDPSDVARQSSANAALSAEWVEKLRTPGAFGPGMKVLGPEVKVSRNASPQDRLLAFLGRGPAAEPATGK